MDVGEKKRRRLEKEEAREAYQTGFQITEVILLVIDSPIATYRISLGSSREENYKREGSWNGDGGNENGEHQRRWKGVNDREEGDTEREETS